MTTTFALPASPTLDLSMLARSDAPTRLSALRAAVGQSVETVRLAAKILSLMEESGDDLAEVPNHLLRMLRAVSAERVVPELVVRTGGLLRQRMALLPMDEQRRLLGDDAMVDVLLPDGQVGAIAVQHLTPPQVRQVFGEGFVRSPVEQRASWREGKPPTLRRPGRSAVTEVHVNKERGGVEFHGHFIPKASLLRWLNDL